MAGSSTPAVRGAECVPPGAAGALPSTRARGTAGLRHDGRSGEAGCGVGLGKAEHRPGAGHGARGTGRGLESASSWIAARESGTRISCWRDGSPWKGHGPRGTEGSWWAWMSPGPRGRRQGEGLEALVSGHSLSAAVRPHAGGLEGVRPMAGVVGPLRQPFCILSPGDLHKMAAGARAGPWTRWSRGCSLISRAREGQAVTMGYMLDGPLHPVTCLLQGVGESCL